MPDPQREESHGFSRVEDVKRVAVVGGSNGGYAAAADFADRGFDVQWYLRTPENHRAVFEDGALALRVGANYAGRRTPGAERTVDVGTVTDDLGEAVAGADRVVVPLPTTTQESWIPALAPHLSDGQAVLLCPGNFGSYLLRRELDSLAGTPDVTVAETPTLPYVTRKSGPAEVTINLDAVSLPVGAFPGADSGRAYEAFSELYPAAIEATDALDAALNNSNACVNATPTLLNAGAVECEEFSFNIHRHGIGRGVYNVISAVDGERVALRESLGYDGPHFTQDQYYRPEEAGGGHFYGSDARVALMGADTFSEDPPSLDDRYVHEDVAIATVLLASLGDHLGVATATVNSLVTVAESMMDEPYRETGRSVAALGLDDLDRPAFERFLETGERP